MQMVLQGIKFIWLGLLTVYGKDFYCSENNEVTRIEGETTGVVITRREEETSYHNNALCEWVVDVGEGNSIEFTIITLDLQWASGYASCSGYDNLELVEGTHRQGRPLVSLCGRTKGNPYHIISRGHQVYLRFSTTPQDFRQQRGVELRFEAFSNTTCPPGWVQTDSSSDYCIFVGDRTTKLNWVTGQQTCGYSQANLISLPDAKDYDFVNNEGQNQAFTQAWIGLSDRNMEGVFKWLDETPLSFTRDLTGNSEKADCVAQDFSTGNWRVHDCELVELNYFCKRRKDGTTVVYSAFPNTEPPEDAGKSNAVAVVVACVVGSVAVVVLIVVVLCYLKRRRRNNSPRFHSPNDSASNESDASRAATLQNSAPPWRVSEPATPSAPEQDPNMLLMRSQLVAPPSYEESKYDPVVPALY